jgi:hypothetical protein
MNMDNPYPDWTDPLTWVQKGHQYAPRDGGKHKPWNTPGLSSIILDDYFGYERDGFHGEALWCLQAAVLLDRWEPVT